MSEGPHRRTVLKGLTAAIGASALPAASLLTGCATPAPDRLIFISLDGLHPGHLDLDANGDAGGSDGDWLMPRVREFVDGSTWYRDAMAFLPAATDMNHLNAVAGTSSAQTGLISVCTQIYGWHEDGTVHYDYSDIANLRDEQGRPVDTLFHAWKRAFPDSKTAFISGKGWVAEMFRSAGVVDRIVTGTEVPDGMSPPAPFSYNDPVDDGDGDCDPVGEGQQGDLVDAMEEQPEVLPSDDWIVEAALHVFEQDDPGLAYILLQQADMAGHLVGTAWDPDEFIPPPEPYVPPAGCEDDPGYQRVSERNPALFRESMLDNVRGIDDAFGKLIDGLEEQGVLESAMVILASDHSMENHLNHTVEDTDFVTLLLSGSVIAYGDMHPHCTSSMASLFWRSHPDNIPAAYDFLRAHRAVDPLTGEEVCPWHVLDRDEMRDGVPGLCAPGELYHEYFVDQDGVDGALLWPDLILLTRSGWQLPIYGGFINHLGIELPAWMPPTLALSGGHGSVETLKIISAIAMPGGAGRVVDAPIRIADLAVTAAEVFGLELRSSTVGVELPV